MALYILQPGIQPAGQFDFLDTDLDNVVGGEVGTLDEASRLNSAAEKSAADARDGYLANEIDVGTATASRPVMRIADSTTETYKLFYLLDDGKAGYGTLFGSVIGLPVGLSTTGSALGPHSAAGSGKVTAWDKPGLYAVSLTALDADVVPTAAGNLYDTPLPGEVLYRKNNSGKMCRDTTSTDKVAQFVELSGNRSLVTTPAKLVGAAEVFDRVVVQYLGASYNA